MPTIVVANTKGGSGKTTLTLTLTSQLLQSGIKVALLEGDPNRPLAEFAQERKLPLIETRLQKNWTPEEARAKIAEAVGDSKVVVITTDNDEDSMEVWLDAAQTWANFVITDPEGSPNQWQANAISQADLVLIPFAPTSLDANQVQNTVKQLRFIERVARMKIPYRMMMTRTNPGAVMTRDERELRDELEEENMPLLPVSLSDRAAFRAMFKFGKFLHELDDTESGSLGQARHNAALLLECLIETLTENRKAAA